MDYLAVGIALLAALVGIRGNTWDSAGKPTRLGIAAVVLALAAAGTGFATTFQGRKARAQAKALENERTELIRKIEANTLRTYSAAVFARPGELCWVESTFAAGTLVEFLGQGDLFAFLYTDSDTQLRADDAADQIREGMERDEWQGNVGGVAYRVLRLTPPEGVAKAAILGDRRRAFRVAVLNIGTKQLQAKASFEGKAAPES